MAKSRRGDRVQVHYTGTLDDGSIFDSSEDGGDQSYRNFRGNGIAFSPMELVIGEGSLIPKLEEAVVGLEPGQWVKVKIASHDAYGPRNEESVVVAARGDIKPRETILESWRMAEDKKLRDPGLSVGDVIEVLSKDGSPAPALVIDVTDTTVTIDANHPLAGRDLTYEIRLVDIL